MTRARIVAAIAALALVLLVATMPLAVLLPGPLVASALTARRADGTIWSGVLRDGQVGGMALGDTAVQLRVLPLLTGTAAFDLAAPLLRGRVASGGGTQRAEGLSGTLDVAGRFAPLPLTTLALDDVGVTFRNDRCLAASGRLRAGLSGDVAGLALPAGLSGIARCDGEALLLPLVSQSGLERIELRLRPGGRWRADVAIRASDPAMTAKLISAGFTAGPAGMTLRMSGQL